MYEDNNSMIKAYQEGQTELLSVIVENNLGLIHMALKGFKWAYKKLPQYGDRSREPDKIEPEEIITYDDFYHEGVFGLCSAIEKYNPELGAFSTCAIIHIRQAIFRFYYDKSRIIRVPYEPHKAYKQIRKAEGEYIKEYGYEPSTKELSKYSGVSFDEILEIRRTFSDPASIDARIGHSDDDSLTIGDSIPDKTDYLEGIERDMTIKALRKDLERMSQVAVNDEDHIRMLFSYFDYAATHSVEEIAKMNNISRTKLNRIINECIMKISTKYLDELIEGYSDLFSSGIRRSREIELFRRSIRDSIKLVASKMIKPEDSITVIDSFSENGLKESVQVTVRKIDPEGINVSYIEKNRFTGEYGHANKWIPYQSIIDFRTENKRIVEIGCVRGLM